MALHNTAGLCAVVLCASLVSAVVTCGLVIRVARYVGFIDRPDGGHKQHDDGVALGGGIAIFLAVALVCCFACLLEPGVFALDLGESPQRLTALVLAALLVLFTGYVDDRYDMKGFHKLGWQTLAAVVLVVGGYQFRAFVFSGFRFDFGHFGVLLSVLWILGAINALNLIDGADGVAATLGVGILGSLGVAVVAANGPGASMISLSMAGALAGFLIYNFPPAKMYLGDSGSMLIGLVAAATAIESSVKTQATFAFAAPLLLLSLPIIDTSLAIFRRKLMGRSIYDTDCGHLHHCLRDNGWSPRQIVGLVAALTVFTSVTATATVYAGFDILSVMAVLLLLGVGIHWKVLGRGEIALIVSRLRGRWTVGKSNVSEPAFVQIQGERNWLSAWEMVVEFAKGSEIGCVEISANAPRFREAFSGRFGDVKLLRSRSCWRLSIPLNIDGDAFGWIEFSGKNDGRSAVDELRINGFVRLLDAELNRIASGDSKPVSGCPVPAPTFANLLPTASESFTVH